MPSNVFYSSMKSRGSASPLKKIEKLIARCGVTEAYEKNDLVAVKVHFGELGNTAYIRPVYLRPVIDRLKEIGAKPFLTDTNTLYVGMRTNSVDHLHNATLNGFNYSTLQVPVIIADGLRGENSVDVPIDGEMLTKVKLAADIVNADALFVMSHFKGHNAAGFGGAIKNLAMGCASRQGKLEMHDTTRPSVLVEKCTICKRCSLHCQASAISFDPHAVIGELCVGCARCIAVCPYGAIRNNWDESSENLGKKLVEYASGVVRSFQRSPIFVNILTGISPDCDCFPGNDAPVVPDIGFLASTDPVALDKASLDMVIAANHGKNPFQEKYPDLDPMVQFAHAERIGLGSSQYQLHETN